MRRIASEMLRNLEMRVARLEANYDNSYGDEDARKLTEALKKGIDSKRVSFKGQRTQESPTRPNRDSMKLVQVDFEYKRSSDVAFDKNRVLTVKMMKNLTRGTVSFQVAVENTGSSRDFTSVRDLKGATQKANQWLSNPKINAKPPKGRLARMEKKSSDFFEVEKTPTVYKDEVNSFETLVDQIKSNEDLAIKVFIKTLSLTRNHKLALKVSNTFNIKGWENSREVLDLALKVKTKYGLKGVSRIFSLLGDHLKFKKLLSCLKTFRLMPKFYDTHGKGLFELVFSGTEISLQSDWQYGLEEKDVEVQEPSDQEIDELIEESYRDGGDSYEIEAQIDGIFVTPKVNISNVHSDVIDWVSTFLEDEFVFDNSDPLRFPAQKSLLEAAEATSFDVHVGTDVHCSIEFLQLNTDGSMEFGFHASWSQEEDFDRDWKRDEIEYSRLASRVASKYAFLNERR